MKISDVLWIAANEYLSHENDDDVDDNSESSVYSCCAVQSACDKLVWLNRIPWHSEENPYEKTRDFLEELGVNIGGFYEFDEFVSGAERQGARYLWLMFAYQVALDEGV